MITEQYRIFNKSIRFHFADRNDVFYRHLSKQLELYPKEPAEQSAALIVSVNVPGFEERFDVLGVNPKIHKEISNGFIADYGQCKTAMYKKDGILHADLEIPLKKGPARSFANKFLHNIEFSSYPEMVGQICFELILVPSIYFDQDMCLVHAAGFSDENGRGILIGGTGGVGKTSMELSLCCDGNYKFLCDDIAVLSKDGGVYPNLAFPKIYGYNLENNASLKAKVFANRTFIDKAAWAYRYYLKGPDKVRRKISPEDIFTGHENSAVPLGKYFILVKESRQGIECSKIDGKTAAQMTIDVMAAEYWRFHNHLRWHSFNCAARNCAPTLILKDVADKWSDCLSAAFRNVETAIVRIPLDLAHQRLMEELPAVIRAV